MVLSADDKSIFTAPELLLSSIGLEDLFFIILIGVAGCCPITPPKNHKNIPITACQKRFKQKVFYQAKDLPQSQSFKVDAKGLAKNIYILFLI